MDEICFFVEERLFYFRALFFHKQSTFFCVESKVNVFECNGLKILNNFYKSLDIVSDLFLYDMGK
jgi:hypothetical protein